jgi:hypothetical protein
MEKRLLIATVLSSFLLGFTFCTGAQVQEEAEVSNLPAGFRLEVLSEPKVVQGTTFSKSSKLVFDQDNFLRTATLGEDQTILDVSYKKQFPHVFKAGTMIQYKEPKNSFGDVVKFLEIPKTITVRKPIDIFGNVFGPGTTLIFPTQGKKPFLGIAVERTQMELTLKGKKVAAGSTLLFLEKDEFRVLNKGEWDSL